MDRELKRIDLNQYLSLWERATEAPNPDDITASTDDAMRRASGRRADTGDFDPSRTSEETRAENADNAGGEAGVADIDTVESRYAWRKIPMPIILTIWAEETISVVKIWVTWAEMLLMLVETLVWGMIKHPTKLLSRQNRFSFCSKKMNQFYQVLKNTCDSLTDYSAPSSTEDLQRIFNQAVGHLSAAKEMLFNLLTSPFTSANYADKLRKYVALRHVYSTILNVLDIHFDVLDQMTQAKQPSK